MSSNCSTTRQSSFAVCSFGKYATNLDHPLDMIFSKAENKMLVIIRTTEIMKLLLSFVIQECKGLSDENG